MYVSVEPNFYVIMCCENQHPFLVLHNVLPVVFYANYCCEVTTGSSGYVDLGSRKNKFAQKSQKQTNKIVTLFYPYLHFPNIYAG